MAVVYNRRTYGLFDNGCFQDGTNRNFTAYQGYTADALSNNSCVGVLINRYGATIYGNEYIPVDTSKTYQFATSVKTIQNNYLGNPGSGHIGFSCFDENKVFIDLRNCGGIGNTTLSRDLNVGDSYAYITSNSGWNTSALYYFRHLMIYPATHPRYSQAYKYTRIGFGDYNICYNATITLMPEGDYRLALEDINGNPITFPNVGYATPAGTPVMNGQAGGTFNYALGAPNYPSSWTTYFTAPFTGESRNSGVPFRFATKFITFLNLANYNFLSQNAGDSARYLVDNIILLEVPPGKTYTSEVFSKRNTF